ncbi:MAG: acyl-CoA thioesterase [Desulfobacterales bacterium]|nr:MAG: acyl-CoA thioesterase [Desulfobacterales bacterium]
MSKNNIFEIDIEVRFRDLDALSHVNNAVYFTYFEEGRKNFSKAIFQVSDPSGFTFILAYIQCDYLMPVKFDDHIKLQMWVQNIGTKSFGFGYMIVDASDTSVVYATGESVQVCYNYAENKSIEVPVSMKKKLSAYLRR